MVTFVLIHSPLVGPCTWELVAHELGRRGHETIIPELTSGEGGPYWKQHVGAIGGALEPVPLDHSVILIGHSGAGMLLPAAGQTVDHHVAGYIFVDAGIPLNNKSRLDFFAPEEAEAFRKAATGGMIPVWTSDDLREVIPDDELREKFSAELRRLPLAVYEEPIPVFAEWPDAPCGYLLFTPTHAYGESAERAKVAGWPYTELAGGHFHMLVDPEAVTSVLLDLVGRMSV